MNYDEDEFRVEQLGECNFDSPLTPLLDYRQYSVNYVEESDRILVENTVSAIALQRESNEALFGLEPAGARRKIFFDPSQTRAGIVTCGGLCPGLNNVIRSLVNELTGLLHTPCAQRGSRSDEWPHQDGRQPLAYEICSCADATGNPPTKLRGS